MEGFETVFTEIPTEVGQYSGGVTELWPPADGVRRFTQLDLLRPGGVGDTHCDLGLDRGAELQLPPATQVILGVAPFEAHGEITLINHGEANATVYVTTPESGTPLVYNLGPGDRAVVAPHAGPQQPYWTYAIENPSPTETIVLGLMEDYSWSLTGIPGGSTPFFTAQLLYDGEMMEQSARVHVIGTDPVPGRTVYVSLHDPDVASGITDDATPAPAGARARLLLAYPNPFAATTHIGFDLPQGGDVRLEFFDPAGRRVRVLEQAGVAPGRGGFDWDGRSADGRSATPGVFFYRLERAGQEEATGRVIRRR